MKETMHAIRVAMGIFFWKIVKNEVEKGFMIPSI